MFKIAGLFMLIVFPDLLFADASQVRYCETAFAENSQWAYPDKESLIKGLAGRTRVPPTVSDKP